MLRLHSVQKKYLNKGDPHEKLRSVGTTPKQTNSDAGRNKTECNATSHVQSCITNTEKEILLDQLKLTFSMVDQFT